MRAIRLNDPGRAPVLVMAETQPPKPASGEVLIRVCATGVTPSELSWYPTSHTKDGAARKGAIPGHEFSGVVAELGSDVTAFAVGQDVFGMNDWFAQGASAELCVARPEQIAAKPASLSHAAAATVPISALTAWQGLFERAKLRSGEHLLVHGGTGAVGLFAVQLGHLAGARVVATASAHHRDVLRQLGADQAIDYRTECFEDVAGMVDVVFDTVGGKTLDHSWQMVTRPERVVTIASESGSSAEERVKKAFFIVEPDGKRLAEIARLIDQGKLKTFIRATAPLEDAAVAYSGDLAHQLTYGKAVLVVP